METLKDEEILLVIPIYYKNRFTNKWLPMKMGISELILIAKIEDYSKNSYQGWNHISVILGKKKENPILIMIGSLEYLPSRLTRKKRNNMGLSEVNQYLIRRCSFGVLAIYPHFLILRLNFL